MLFWKKERLVEQAVEQYLHETESCVKTFVEAMDVFGREGASQRFDQLMEQTHLHESAADDKRRDVERSMYNRELIPESRGDILGMLEALDLVPNKCESVLYNIWMQAMVFPAQYAAALADLVRINAESADLLFQTARSLFRDPKRIAELARQVDEKEGESDQAERSLIRSIFQSDMDKADMILLKDLILRIGSISDRAENAADRLSNIAVKRPG